MFQVMKLFQEGFRSALPPANLFFLRSKGPPLGRLFLMAPAILFFSLGFQSPCKESGGSHKRGRYEGGPW